MLRKYLLVTICFCLMFIPMALADNGPAPIHQNEVGLGREQLPGTENTVKITHHEGRTYEKKGTRHTERDGRGDVISWADTEPKCREGGHSWVSVGGDVVNFERGH